MPQPPPPPPDSIKLPGDAPLACPASLPSPMPQASNVLHAKAGDMTCEAQDAAGGAKRVGSGGAPLEGRRGRPRGGCVRGACVRT